jgi:hypothetical protein
MNFVLLSLILIGMKIAHDVFGIQKTKMAIQAYIKVRMKDKVNIRFYHV